MISRTFSLSILSSIILLSTSLNANAEYAENIYLHNKKQAESEYNRYKSDTDNNIDPFEKIRNGYNSNLSKTIENSVKYDKLREMKNSLSDEQKTLSSTLLSASEKRQAEKQRLYNQYSIDGYFNHNAYNSGLLNINSEIKKTTNAMLSARSASMQSVINKANVQLKKETVASEANSLSAAKNLIELMNNDSTDKVHDINSKITSAQSSSSYNYRVGSQAVTLADNWNTNCGSACTLPPPPPPPPTEPDVDPWEDVRAGCYIDTKALDVVRTNNCIEHGFRTEGQPPAIVFSVGNMSHLDNYYFDMPVTVSWGGDCKGNHQQCTIYGPCSGRRCGGLGQKEAIATVTLNGETRTFKVSANDKSKQMGDEEER